MIYLNSIFSNAEEFKRIFGTPDNRTAKLRLAMLKSKAWWQCRVRDHVRLGTPLQEFTPTQVMDGILSDLRYGRGRYDLFVGDDKFLSDIYRTGQDDDRHGLCFDGDCRSIRYTRVDNGKVYKMRAGKMLRALAEEHDLIAKYGEPLINYACEEFQRRWEAYAKPYLDEEYFLVVDDDFEAIYDGNRYKDGKTMHSCMTNQGYHTFYENAVKAKAASLRDNNGDILSRCIIFTEVHDNDTDEVLRLAERQYAIDCDQSYMRILVNKLIEGGHIDGYKAVGASCGDARAFVANDGTSWSRRRLWIDCYLDEGDTVSYMDSFKWWDKSSQVADNYDCGCDFDLATTDGVYEDLREYDEYHDRYCCNVTYVYVEGRRMTCDSDDMDDFVYCESEDEYHHYDDVVDIHGYYYSKQCDDILYCEECGQYYHVDDEMYSELLDESFCSETCMEEAELRYKKRNWYYNEYTDEYFETQDEMVKECSEEMLEEHGMVWSHWQQLWVSVEDSKEFWEYDHREAGYCPLTVDSQTFTELYNDGLLRFIGGRWYRASDNIRMALAENIEDVIEL